MKRPPLHAGLIPEFLLNEYGAVDTLAQELKSFHDAVLQWTAIFRMNQIVPGTLVISLLKSYAEWMAIDTALLRCGSVHVPFQHYAEVRKAMQYFDDYKLLLDDSLIENKSLFPSDIWWMSDLRTSCSRHLKPDITLTYAADISPDSPAMVVFTYDNHGTEQPFVITHSNLIETAFAAGIELPLQPGDVYLSMLPLSKMYGRISLMTHQLRGCRLQFAGQMLLPASIIQQSNAASVAVVPAHLQYPVKVYAGLKKYIPNRSHVYLNDLPSEAFSEVFGKELRMLICGGAMLPAYLSDLFHQSNIFLAEGYGLTQTTGVFTMNTPALYKKGSQGKAIAGMELCVSDDGEIFARGNGICSGIMQSDGSVFPAVNAEGWLATGDEGYLDEAGFLYITGNRKPQLKLANGYYYDPRIDENDISEKLQSASMLCRDDAGNIHALSVKETLSDAEKSFLEHFKIRIFALSLSSVSLVKSLPLKRPYVFTPLSDAIFLRRQNM